MAETPSAPSSRIEVLDYVRGLAIIHIILYHYFLEHFGGRFLIVPDGIAANIERLRIFQDGGVLEWMKNIFGFFFAYGFFSVNLFLLLSGFVLTYSALKSERKAPTSSNTEPHSFIEKIHALVQFYWRKMKRVVIPLYISIIIGIGFLYLRNILFPQFAAAPVYSLIDILKLLFIPFFVYDIVFLQKFNGDLWFITLILQLYILFPLLHHQLKRWGVWKFLAAMLVITLAYRYIATYWLSTAPMGVIYPAEHSYRLFSFFLPRLFEFCFGMALAYLYMQKNDALERLTGAWGFIGGVVLTFAGFAFDMYRWGWPYSDLTVSIGLFLVFLNIGALLGRSSLIARVMVFLSDSSYENFLLHHYWLNYFLTPLLLVLGLQGEGVFWAVMPFYVLGAIAIGWGAQKIGAKLG